MRLLVNKYVIPEEHLFLHLCNLQKLERVAEIGVFGGGLTKRVLQNCSTIKEYYAIDPWKVYIESYDRPPEAKESSQEWWEELYQKVVDIQKLFPDSLIIKRMESIKCSRELKAIMTSDDQKLDAIYIDSIHDAPNLANDIWAWIDLIKDYGTISGHDYIKRYWNMMDLLEDIFGDDLNFWIVDPAKHRRSYKNQGQGGNWWVNLTPDVKKRTKRIIRDKYSKLLFMGNQDQIEYDYGEVKDD